MKYPFLLCLAFIGSALGQTVSKLNLTDRNGLVFADVMVNGHNALLLVDTGATLTVLRPTFIKGHPTSSTVTNSFAMNNRIPTIDASIEVGGENYTMQVGLFEVKAFREGDGILGSDFFRCFKSIRIDYKAHVIELTR